MREINTLEYVFKRVDNNSSMVINRAEDICNDKVYLISTLEELKVESIDEIWNLESKPVNTYKVYLYSIQILAYLNSAYSLNKNKKYLDKGFEIIKSWIRYIEKGLNNQYVYYDFAVANRVMIITEYINICLISNYKLENKFINKLLKTLKIDIEFLNNDKYYREDNHGLMMDRALLQFASLFSEYPNSKDLRNKAAERIIKQFEFSFGDEYLNIENSPEYHNLNYRLFKDINDFIHINKVDSNIEQFNLDKVYENHLILLKQDYSYPLVGDTSKIFYKDSNPKIESKVFKKTGVAVLKDNDSYLLCKSGFSSKAHKHYDDNSFVFSYKNKDIFIDSGKYSYNSKDDLRKYMISTFAHNTICVNNKNYELNFDKCGIVSSQIYENTSIVKLLNNSYENIKIERSIVKLQSNLLVIYDQIKSDNKNIYTKVFNINNDFSVISINDKEVQLSDGELLLNINEINEVDKIHYYKGYKDNNGIIRGFHSEKFNELKENNSINYIYKADNLETLSVIQINSNSSLEIKSYNIIYNQDSQIVMKVIYSDGNEKYYNVNFTDSNISEVNMPKIEIEYEKNIAKISLSGGDYSESAAYFKINNKLEKSIPYSNKRYMEYKFKSNGKVEIWIFILLPNGIKISEKFEL